MMEYRLYKVVPTDEATITAKSDSDAYDAARNALMNTETYPEPGVYVLLDQTNKRWVADFKTEDNRRIANDWMRNPRYFLQSMPRLLDEDQPQSTR